MVAAARKWLCTALCAALACSAWGCARNCHLDQCDIRDEACQRAVLTLTLCVRGGDPVEVPVHVVDADAYTEEQVAETEADEDAERVARAYAGLALLRLVAEDLSPAEVTRMRVDDTAAFYSPDDEAITILDRGQALDGFGVALTLVHEYVHALQDAEHDLPRVYDDWGQTFDASLAVAAVIEGEASLYQARAAAEVLGYDLDDLDFERGYRAYGAFTRASLSKLDDPFAHLYGYFAYAYGAPYVDAAVREGGTAAVDALFDAPPVSTRQVITGYGEPPPGGEPWLEPALDEEGVPVLGSSYAYVTSWHAGTYALWAFLNRWLGEDLPGPRQFEPLLQLRADVLSVFDRADGRGAIVAWRLRFSGARHAGDFVERLRRNTEFNRAGGTRMTWVIGRDALVMAGRDAIDPLPDFKALAWQAVPEEE